MDIKLINAGHGAGKTHALIEWVRGADNRFIVGLHGTTGDKMEAAGVSEKFVHYNEAEHALRGRTDIEVAFDTFNELLPGLLMTNYGLSSAVKSVILATNLPDSELLVGPDPLLGVVTPDEDPEAGFTRGIWKKSPEESELPVPFVSVRADQLRLGDVIRESGEVSSLLLDADNDAVVVGTYKKFHIGTIRAPRDYMVEIEN